MSRITNLFARHLRNVHILVIILLCGLLIIKPTLITPSINEVTIGVFYSPFALVKNSIMDLTSVAEENRRFHKELAEATVTLAMYEEAYRENERLRSVQGFAQSSGYQLKPAEVISVAGKYYPIAAVIDRGTQDSIYLDQTVINQQGLIGRIGSVSEGYATVQLLTDPSNRVAARTARSREVGIIKFSAAEGMILDNFPIQGTISVNDTILSSGLGGIYPPGLVVGYVTEVVRPELEPFCKVKVKPAVNFHSLDELFLIVVEDQ